MKKQNVTTVELTKTEFFEILTRALQQGGEGGEALLYSTEYVIDYEPIVNGVKLTIKEDSK